MLSLKCMSIVSGIVFLGAASAVFADPAQVKVYKEAFPEEKPKCIACHIDAIPKKDAGKHDLNEYGKKILELNAKPTAVEYKTVGKAEEFKSGQENK